MKLEVFKTTYWQYVSMNGFDSSLAAIHFVVPQDSVWAALLFLYINTTI